MMAIFVLVFCFGGLYELKNTESVLEMAQRHNATWEEYCGTLIEKIKTLERSDTND